MAVETPTAPAPSATTAQATAKPAAELASAPVKPVRLRNEYPEAYDGLEELDRLHQESGKGGDVTTAAPRDPYGKFAPKPPEQKQLTPSVTEPEKDKPTEGKDAPKPVEKKEGAEPESKNPDANGEPDPTAKFTTAYDLRKELRRLHREVQVKELELNTIKERVKTDSPVSTAALEENKTLKKRNDELEAEIRYYDYTKSKEFKEQFEKPYQEAYDEAVQEIQELEVLSPDGQNRPATEKDLRAILKADQSQVRRLAKEMFGEAADDVLSARRKLNELNRKANKQSERFREESAERDRQKALKTAEERENTERLWNKALLTIREKYPEFFQHIEGDEEYNKELDAGYAVIDKAHTPGLPLEEKISRLAAARHKAAAFRAQVLVNKRLRDENAELRKVIAGYEKSAPGAGSGESADRKPQGSKDKDGYVSYEEEIDALDVKG